MKTSGETVTGNLFWIWFRKEPEEKKNSQIKEEQGTNFD